MTLPSAASTWYFSPLQHERRQMKQVAVLTVIKTTLILSLWEHNLLILLRILFLPAYVLQFNFPISSVGSYNIPHSLEVSCSSCSCISQTFLLLYSLFISLSCLSFAPTFLLTVFVLLFISFIFSLSFWFSHSYPKGIAYFAVYLLRACLCLYDNKALQQWKQNHSDYKKVV